MILENYLKQACDACRDIRMLEERLSALLEAVR